MIGIPEIDELLPIYRHMIKYSGPSEKQIVEYAIRHDMIDIVRFFYEEGIVDLDWNFVAYNVAVLGSIQIIKFLYEQGIRQEFREIIDIATSCNHDAIGAFYLRYDPDPLENMFSVCSTYSEN